jgi:type IV pilus biogenesis protein CpaD/CtpE
MKRTLCFLAIPAMLALAACRPGAAEYTEAEAPKLLRIDRAAGRYMVTLPDCPNWSQYPASDFTNAKSSNFGCATASNLGLMVANPADLVAGRELAHADGTPAVSAVTRYLTDKVKLPETSSGAGALTAPSSSGGAPAAGAGTPTGTP